ncbi:MAG: HEAT repeat domain-containing protein [Treponema sp.]|jgi:HEAT repeat protein|nr:HEAT repeat domain-containing protein [Treponema sp.]
MKHIFFLVFPISFFFAAPFGALLPAQESNAAEIPEEEGLHGPEAAAPDEAATADEAGVRAENAAGTKKDPPADTLEASRLATIHYGTETEIAGLIQALRNEGSDYLDDELAALSENTRNPNILSGLFSFFGDREKSGLEDRAIRAIEERDEETTGTVLSAAEYIGKVKAARAVPVLRELLDSREQRFMNTAFRALGRAGGAEGNNETADYLIDYYTNGDPGEENRREIITALGAVGSKNGVAFLSEIAESDEERLALRIAALDSLSKIGDAEGLKAILVSIGAGDPNVRSGAVAALGPFSGEEVDKAILEAFRDSYYRTRLAAAQAARQRRLEAAIPYLKFRAERDDIPQVKDEAIRALGAIGNEESDGIVESLFNEKKNSDRVRLVAAEMLMKNNPAKYLDRLILELDEAKRKNQTALYNGFLKSIGEAKTESLESIARRFLKDGGVLEKSYGLDMAANNGFVSLAGEIRAVAGERSESLARKARRTLEKLGIAETEEEDNEQGTGNK